METTRPNIRAIAFDYGGVLAHFIDESTLCHMADAAGVPIGVFGPALWGHRAGYDSGELDSGTYWRAVLDTCGSDKDRATLVEQLLELDALGWSRINLGTLRWARVLKQHGYRTLIISNMAAATYEMVIRDHMWTQHFEYIVISGWIGVNKPAPEIFWKATTDLRLEPSEVLFLDDKPDNVTGAQEAGLRAVTFGDTHVLAEQLRSGYPEIPTCGLVCNP